LWVELITGAKIRLFGADNPDSLRGLYLDGVILDEYADMRPRVWGEIIRPLLADREGWAVFIGTPKGHNGFYDIWKASQSNDAWFSASIKASESQILPEAELRDAAKGMTEDQYQQEFECSFDAAIVGAYYADQIKKAEDEGRIGKCVPFDAALSVNTAWDLGMGDDTAIWVYQNSPAGQVRVIDYIENHGVGLDWYVREIKQKSLEKGWTLGEHLLPHDVEVRELGTGKSRFDTLTTLGIFPRICPKLGVDDGINAVRMTFSRMWFDNNEAVLRGVDALKQYRREYDEKRQIFYERPLRNFATHASDAMRYLAVGLREASSTVPIRRALKGIV
jgi:hypothetical protein